MFYDLNKKIEQQLDINNYLHIIQNVRFVFTKMYQ